MQQIFPNRSVSRRQFLGACGFGGALIAGPAWLPVRGDDSVAGRSLIVRERNPLNAEPELANLVEHWITPVDQFFVRTHGNIPQPDEKSFQLQVEGLVETPLRLSLPALKDKYPSTTTTATLTCAGNRRAEFADARIKGVAWQAGAIGNAEWNGVRLSELLKTAGIKPEAKHVWFEGEDEIRQKNELIHFGASVPVERVLDSQGVGVLLADRMNGQPLTPEHGAPLRAITPGFIGARSVKWLRRIIVSDKPSPNHFVAHAYKLVDEDTLPAQEAADPLYEFVLNSAIGAVKRTASLRVQGYALPMGRSKARIKRVELSVDDGNTWHVADLDDHTADYCWQLWKADVPISADGQRLLVRAIDTTGAIQPRTSKFNAKGYHYNGWHSVPLTKNG